jgi:hypothetical protein
MWGEWVSPHETGSQRCTNISAKPPIQIGERTEFVLRSHGTEVATCRADSLGGCLSLGL